jgi:glycosyltransferase involved in cell wall biosynthesis
MIVSACIITYNQELYIRDCLQGAISQNLNYQYEIVIGEDCSTDRTLQICKEFERKYPNTIKLLPSTKNLGMAGNWERTISQCTGKYIAICEGDDFWIDPYKLQKQIYFLEENKEFSMCFHNAYLLRNGKNLSEKFRDSKKRIYKTKDVILDKWFSPTASVVFRKESLKNYAAPLEEDRVKNRDLLLLFDLSLHGKLYYIDEVMSVYRCNVEGGMTDLIKNRSEIYLNHLNYLHFVNRRSAFKYSFTIYIKIIYILLAYLKYGLIKKIIN